MAPEYLTINEFPVGTTGFYEFQLAGGYLEKAHVKLDFVTEVGARTNYPLSAGMFVTEFSLQIPVEDIPPGTASVRIYRETPREEPLISFTNGARLNERNLDRLAAQTIFVAAEAFDAGAFAVAEDLIGQALTAIETTQTLVEQAQDIVDVAASAQAASAASAALALTRANTAVAAADAAALSEAAAAASAAATAGAVAAEAALRVAADVALQAAIDAEAAARAAADNLRVSKDSNTGAARLPKGTTAQRPVAPQPGDTRFNEDTDQLEVRKAADWAPVGAGASGGTNNPFVYEADQVVTVPYVMPTNKNGFSPGPLTFGPSGSITVGGNSVFTIVT